MAGRGGGTPNRGQIHRTYLADEIAGPLGASFFIGLPERKSRGWPASSPSSRRSRPGTPLLAKMAEAAGGGDEGIMKVVEQFLSPGAPLFMSLSAPGGAFSDQEAWETRALHAAEIPAANGICDARSLACLYAGCVSEVTGPSGKKMRIIEPEQLDRALRPADRGTRPGAPRPRHPVGLGFMVNKGIIAEGKIGGPRSFGHFGMGGSVGWADPDLELGMGYVMNRMDMVFRATCGATGSCRPPWRRREGLRALTSVSPPSCLQPVHCPNVESASHAVRDLGAMRSWL